MNRKLTALNILRLRKDNHLTQEQVAEYLHIDQSTYHDLEAGHSEPTADRLDKLAQLYKTTVERIIVPDHPTFQMHDNQVANGYNALNVQHQGPVESEVAQEILVQLKEMIVLVKQQNE